MNIIGERQHPEKFIPLVINKVLDGETVFIHSNKEKTKAGVRSYIHARNVAAGYKFLVDTIENHATLQGCPILGEEYHIVGEEEVDNLRLAQTIADILGKELKYEMIDFHSSRPGHDLRYALDGSKIAKCGWQPPVTFHQSLEKVIKWSIEHPEWLGRK
jgi:dTDP-glucose 4,6-dehydratase